MNLFYNQYMMNKDHLDPSTILSLIEHNPLEKRTHKFIVMGKTGPTGKTWLTDKLKEIGCEAVELSEDVYGLLEYTDYNNHYITDFDNKTSIIILNHPLED